MAWVQIELRNEILLGFTYEDPSVGLSAKGAVIHPESLAADVRRVIEQPDQTVRLNLVNFNFPTTPLPPEAIRRLGLPAEPPWMRFFRPAHPQPWRADPALSGRFHSAYPDDLQVRFVFERASEEMWVRTTGADPSIGGYTGTLLNDPHTTDSGLEAGAVVSYRMAPGSPDPIWVSQAVRADMAQWAAACDECGFDMLLEPAEAVVARQFQTGLEVLSFTTRCPMCGHGMLVERRD